MNTLNFYLVLDSTAVSICNYKAEYFKSKNEIVDINTLKRLISYANTYDYIFSFVHGRELPQEYYQVLSSCRNQTNIMDSILFEKLYYMPNVTVSFDADKISLLNKRKMSQDLNRSAIIHFNQVNITQLFNAVISLLRISRRITIVCDDYSYYMGSNRIEYENELRKISELLKSEIRLGKLTEINVLTDSIFVDTSNQCPAGVNSFAFSTDGKLFPCPAFIGMRDWELPFSCGNGFENKLETIFSMRPICCNCSNNHCRRCAFINYLFTKEICIPPYEACEIATIENHISSTIYG